MKKASTFVSCDWVTCTPTLNSHCGITHVKNLLKSSNTIEQNEDLIFMSIF